MHDTTGELIVAVDGGGTGCRVRLADRAGREIASAKGGPANVNTDFDAAQANILEAVAAAYRAAGLDPARRGGDVAWLGLAGAAFADLARRMEGALGFAKARVTTDSDTTVEGALGGTDGTVALIGTGSFFVRREGGRERHIGGWGYHLGDECSGAWLGRELLRAVLLAHDGLIEHSPLTKAVFARYDEVPGAMVRHAQAATPGEIARLAPEVAEARAAGDPVAGEIMGRGLDLLCERLEALGAGESGPLYMMGGLGPVYQPLLPARYGRLCRPAHGDALSGAITLARRHLLGCEGVAGA